LSRAFKFLIALYAALIWVYPLGNAQEEKRAHVFTFRLYQEPQTLDWNRAHTAVETHLLTSLMEGLVTLDQNLQVKPALAESWSMSRDRKTYTFKLKPNLKWSDGVKLRAQDFVYSWKRLLTTSTTAPYAYLLFDIVGAQDYYGGKLQDFSKVGVRAVDDSTFQVELTRPLAHWMYIPSFWVTFPLREDIVQKYGSSWTAPGNMVTVGPYSLYSYQIDSKLILRPNPFYHGERGNIDEIVALLVRDDATALKLYEAGRIDFLTDISILDLKRLKGREDLHIFPYLKTVYMGFVISKKPSDQFHFRRAVAFAINKEKLGELLGGGQLGARSFIPPSVLGFSEKLGLPFDTKLAQAEFKKSGLTLPLQVQLLVPNSDRSLLVVQYIQSELKKNLGIDIVIEAFDHKTFLSQANLKTYPIFLFSWSADFPDPDNFMSLFLSHSGSNRISWKSQSFDDQVLLSRQIFDPKKRETSYFQVQRLLQENEGVALPLYYDSNPALIKSHVKNLRLSPINHMGLKNVSILPISH
jgi:oligopeptide transport system substrate-binding protein